MSLTPETRAKLATLKERIAVCHLFNGEKVGFNMAYFDPEPGHPDRTGHECGTVCCIGGHAILMKAEELKVSPVSLGFSTHAAADYLGISRSLAATLFYPETSGYRHYSDISVREAQEAIQSVLDSDGQHVVWDGSPLIPAYDPAEDEDW